MPIIEKKTGYSSTSSSTLRVLKHLNQAGAAFTRTTFLCRSDILVERKDDGDTT